MIKYGEITSIESNSATVRIYKYHPDKDPLPTAQTLNAFCDTDVQIGNMVKIEINMFLFFLSTAFGYIFPFLTGAFSQLVCSFFTDNIIISQSVFLITLALTYIWASHFTKKASQRKNTVCKVISLVE